jgi:hypothetical protein
VASVGSAADIAQLPASLPSPLLQGPAGAAGNNQLDHFVKVEGSSFVVDCRRFFVSGWNMWELVEAAAGGLELFGASLPPNTTGPALVRRLLDRAVANKFNVLRAWAHTVSPQYALQARSPHLSIPQPARPEAACRMCAGADALLQTCARPSDSSWPVQRSRFQGAGLCPG